ncbi:MAG: tetratricopeptide repeat protein [Bacteroidota bacterium]|nr:tetratricopeptide repeat protein [Bacteroidota bacterium]MDP4236744.1 tetratricopeptide repeat protein [Bacteroidota bacterium]
MSADQSASSSNENKPQSTRIEDILLERLKNEPKIAPQLGKPILVAIILFTIALGFGIYFFSRSPEKFMTEDPHKGQVGAPTADSSDLNTKRMQYAPLTDSLIGVIAANPNDAQAHLMLANVYYEAELWDKAKPQYEYFLAKYPEDVDARVDYALVLAQTTGNYKASVAEIKKALQYDPEHINALFNAGILTIRANLDDKQKAVRDAKPFFDRALAAAKKQNNDKMAEQIEKIKGELDKLEEDVK